MRKAQFPNYNSEKFNRPQITELLKLPDKFAHIIAFEKTVLR